MSVRVSPPVLGWDCMHAWGIMVGTIDSMRRPRSKIPLQMKELAKIRDFKGFVGAIKVRNEYRIPAGKTR